jgi:hypothetical protein
MDLPMVIIPAVGNGTAPAGRGRYGQALPRTSANRTLASSISRLPTAAVAPVDRVSDPVGGTNPST